MNINPIHTEKDYLSALSRPEEIFSAKNGTPGDELEILSILIEKYEDEHYKIEVPNPIEAIEFRMEQLGMEPGQFQELLKVNIQDILENKRKLNLSIIRKLTQKLNIPAEILVKEY